MNGRSCPDHGDDVLTLSTLPGQHRGCTAGKQSTFDASEVQCSDSFLILDVDWCSGSDEHAADFSVAVLCCKMQGSHVVHCRLLHAHSGSTQKRPDGFLYASGDVSVRGLDGVW